MISLHVFMLGVLITSTLTGLATEAIKKLFAEHSKNYYANTLAGIVSVILSVAIGIGYMMLSSISFNSQAIEYLDKKKINSWHCAMVGYDKVVQAISQCKAASAESTSGEE